MAVLITSFQFHRENRLVFREAPPKAPQKQPAASPEAVKNKPSPKELRRVVRERAVRELQSKKIKAPKRRMRKPEAAEKPKEPELTEKQIENKENGDKCKEDIQTGKFGLTQTIVTDFNGLDEKLKEIGEAILDADKNKNPGDRYEQYNKFFERTRDLCRGIVISGLARMRKANTSGMDKAIPNTVLNKIDFIIHGKDPILGPIIENLKLSPEK